MALSFNLPGKPGWPEALLILLATAGTITALARQLPLQNVLLAAFVIALMGGAAHALGVMMGIPFGPFLFGPDSRTAIFQHAAVGDAVDLGRRGFEFAGCGAADFASVAENPKLWLLAHRSDGGTDDAVRPRLRPVRLARETLLALDADQVPGDVAGRAAGEFFELGGRWRC